MPNKHHAQKPFYIDISCKKLYTNMNIPVNIRFTQKTYSLSKQYEQAKIKRFL